MAKVCSTCGQYRVPCIHVTWADEELCRASREEDLNGMGCWCPFGCLHVIDEVEA